MAPTNATIYLFNSSGVAASSYVYNHAIQSFDGTTLIGDDSADNGTGSRAFDGMIDDVAIFNKALSQNQLLTLYSVASGVATFAPVVAVPPASATLYIGQTAQFTGLAAGTEPLTYQWMAGTSESYLRRMEILGQDGETDEGKPYFRIPRGSAPDLPPYTESSPATVRIRNKDYLIVFTPFFRVYGTKRSPVPAKTKENVSPTPTTTPTDKLIQLLIQKGVFSEEEGRALYPR